MTITETSLDSGAQGSAVTSQATASITPGANQLILLAVYSVDGSFGTPVVPTASGCGLTWVQVATQTLDVPSFPLTDAIRVTLFRAMGASPTTGAITITFSAASTAEWSVSEFSSTDTSGSNGSGAIVQNAHSKVTAASLTETLSAFGSPNNVAYGAFGSLGSANGAAAVGSGFTLIHNTGPNDFLTEYKANDTTVDFSVATSGGLGGIAIEIKAAVPASYLRHNMHNQAVKRAAYY